MVGAQLRRFGLSIWCAEMARLNPTVTDQNSRLSAGEMSSCSRGSPGRESAAMGKGPILEVDLRLDGFLDQLNDAGDVGEQVLRQVVPRK